MRRVLCALFIIGCYVSINAQVFLKEDFEPRTGYKAGELPPGWVFSYVKGDKDWKFQTGGHDYNPDTAAQGSYNAAFFVASLDNDQTKLVTSAFSLKGAIKPLLRFKHVQQVWPFGGVPYVDELRVYYKTSALGVWKAIPSAVFTEAVNQWTQREVLLNASDVSTTYYLAFEGKSGYGHGTCIDDIQVIEGGSQARQVSDVTASQAAINPIASGSTNNPIIRIDINAIGNTGTLSLKSIKFKSLNTSDADVVANGVKLFATTSDIFSDQNQLGTATSFVAGVASFSGLSYDLPFGSRYIWLTYDIAASVGQGHVFDAFLAANDMTVEGKTFPTSDLSPSGNRVIVETLYSDGFETLKDWTLNGFQISSPTGLGGSGGGQPDPATAANGSKVLGTGFSSTKAVDCDYAINLKDREWYAVSPKIPCKYFKNTTLRFDRWLNVELWDNAYIDIKATGDSVWTNIWATNQRYFIDSRWTNQEIDISAYADRRDTVQIRFSLGSTSDNYNYSGWNIDNFAITGKFIANDMTVTACTAPVSGCGHTSNDVVIARFLNKAGKATASKIPVAFSFDGGVTYVHDTISGSLGVGKDTLFKFHSFVNLSQPGVVTPIIKACVANDDEPSNDSLIAAPVQVVPSYSFPYIADYENNNGFWFVDGSQNTSWQWGKPSSTKIKTAGSGLRAWKTNLSGIFNYNDSSFVVSPCFDMRGNDFPVVEMLVNANMVDSVAGATLQYTVNNGKTWTNVPQIDSLLTKWNWYNTKTNVPLQTKMGAGLGWSGTTSDWQLMRHFLPSSLRTQSKVQFRFAFASVLGLSTDGFAFDKLRLYDAPLDIGVTQLVAPVSACELTNKEKVTITIKNYGLDTLKVGTVLNVGYAFAKQAVVKENVTLASNLLPGASFDYTFTARVDLSHAGNYALKTFTCSPADINFFGKLNDSLSKTVRVYGMPDYDLGATFGSELNDSVALDAQAGYVSYVWDNGFNKQIRKIKNAGVYKVTVTNSEGCTAKDSIKVYYSARDLGVVQVNGLSSACTFTASVTPQVVVKNIHLQQFDVNDTIVVAYRVNKGVPVYDSIFLTAPFITGQTLNHTFSKAIDFSAVGSYLCEFYTVLEKDIKHSNDTTPSVVENYGFPSVDLGKDTVFTKNPKGIVLSVPTGFKTYTWQDAVSEATYSVADSSSKKYSVVVTDVHNCGQAKDSIQFITYDFAADSLLNPHTACSFTKSEIVSFRLKNKGTDAFPVGQKLKISYSLNNAVPVVENYTLSKVLLPDSAVIVNFATPLDLSKIQSYTIKVAATLHLDKYAENDTIDDDFIVYGYPIVNIGRDTIRTIMPDTVVFSATWPKATYLWDDLSQADKFRVTKPISKWYYVTVTANECATKDSSLIWAKDYTISDIIMKDKYCELSSNEKLSIEIRNASSDSIKVGETVELGVIVDGGVPQMQTITLSSTLYALGLLKYEFPLGYDLSKVGNHTIKAFIGKADDVNKKNDTLSKQVVVYGYPKPDLRVDSIVTTNPLSVSLQVAKDFTKYWWKKGSYSNYGLPTGYIYSLKDNVSDWYFVKVENIAGCLGYDSVRVITRDVSLLEISNPKASCLGKLIDTIRCKIQNQYSPLYAGDTLFMHRQLNSEHKVDTLVLSKTIANAEIIDYSFKDVINTSAKTLYSLNVWFEYKKDVDTANNRSIISFSNYGNPTVSLGVDTIRTLRPDTVKLTVSSPNVLTNWIWSDNVTDNSQPFTYLAKLASMNYNVMVYDANNCTASDTVFVVTDDITVVNLPSPVNSCGFSGKDTVRVTFKNTGVTSITPSQAITARYSVNGTNIVSEKLVLSSDLPVGGEYTYTFAQTVDLSQGKSFIINASVSLKNEVDLLNNAVSRPISKYDAPVIAFAQDTMFTTQPDTVMLDAGVGFTSYKWGNGSSAQVLPLVANSAGWYAVTVSNSNGCKASDSVCVVNRDLAVVSVVSPVSACTLSANESVSVMLQNMGKLKYLQSSSITAFLKLDNNLIATENISLKADLMPDEKLLFTFAQSVDLQNALNKKLHVQIVADKDASKFNDSISAKINAWGYPILNFDKDTILTVRPDTLKLCPAKGYASYAWSNGMTTETIIPNNTKSQLYKVLVSNDHGCTSNDSVYVLNRDITLLSIVTPVSACKLTTNEPLSIEVLNSGADAIPAGAKIPVQVSVNSNVYTDTLRLLTALAAGNSLVLLAQNIDLSTLTSVDLSVVAQTSPSVDWYKFDAESKNNTAKKSVVAWGFPSISFATDSILSSRPDTLRLSVGAGFAKYTWDDGQIKDTITASLVTKYWMVEVENEHACSSRDSVFIRNRDITVSSIVSPQSSCLFSNSEPVVVEIKNLGFDVLPQGAKIPVSIYLDDVLQYTEIVNIPSSLVSGQSLKITTQNIDLSTRKTAKISAVAVWKLDALALNDSAFVSINAYGKPIVGLAFDTIQTNRPDTVLLVAKTGYSTYSWEPALSATNVLQVGSRSGWYKVTVSDAKQCSATDSVFVYSFDVAISGVKPKSACKLTANEHIEASLVNTGGEDLLPGTVIPLQYTVNSVDYKDTIVLTSKLLSKQKVSFVSKRVFDMSQKAIFNVSVKLLWDTIQASILNDTTSSKIAIWGYPIVSMPKYIHSSKPDTLRIGLKSGYASYAWSNGSTDDTLRVTSPLSTWYHVTVDEGHACLSTDSVLVATSLLKMNKLINPVDKCVLTNNELLKVQLLNEGVDTIKANTPLSITWTLNGVSTSESIVLANTILPNDSYIWTSSKVLDMSISKQYLISGVLYRTFDKTRMQTDSQMVAVNHYGLPSLQLAKGVDSVKTSLPYKLGTTGFAQYKWSSGQITDTITVSRSGYYAVTATTSHGCEASDGVIVWAHDLALTRFVFPTPQICQDKMQSTLDVLFKNNGLDTIRKGSVVKYKYTLAKYDYVNQTIIPLVKETTYSLTLANDLLPDSTLNLQVSGITAWNSSADFLVFMSLIWKGDINKTNDTMRIKFSVRKNIVMQLYEGKSQITLKENESLVAPTGFEKYKWSTGSTEATIPVTTSGSYSLTVTDASGCSASDAILVVLDISSLDEDIADAFKIYPVPSFSKVSVKAMSNKIQAYKLFDAKGQLVLSSSFDDLQSDLQIPIDVFPNGLYWLQLLTEHGMITKIIEKQ